MGPGGQMTGASLEDSCPFCAGNENTISSSQEMKTQSAPRMEKLTQVSLCLLTRLSVPTPPLMICRCSILRPQRADSCQSEPQVESRPWGWHASLSQSLALNSAQAFGLATTTRERKRRRKKERRRADCAPAVPGSCQLAGRLT